MKYWTAYLCGFALYAPLAHAGFFIPKDTTMAMGMYTPDTQSTELMHGLSREWSVGGGWSRYVSDDEEIDRDFAVVRGNYLLHRSYDSDGITNVYVYGGPLSAWSTEHSGAKPGLQAGLWADYETRRVYFRGTVQTNWTEDFSQTVITTQALWAPYAADYEDVATWIGAQAERRNGLSDATQITPLLRFFQRTWWIDLGVSVNRTHRGDAFINFMYLF